MGKNHFKLSFNSERYGTKTKFIVNEKKRTVVCILEGFLKTPTPYFEGGVWIDSNYFKVVGVAKCSPEDTFDVERGKRIAMAKAENLVYLEALKYLEPYMKNMEDALMAATAFSDKVYRTCAHNEEYIARLSCPNHPDYIADLAELKKRNK